MPTDFRTPCFLDILLCSFNRIAEYCFFVECVDCNEFIDDSIIFKLVESE